MSKKVENASVKPKRFFGLHMVDGTAEYEEDGKAPYKIFINEQTIRKMGPSFEGCPVYVQHVDEVDLENIQLEADGYVVKSFYNAADGKHWVEFMVISDRGHQAISKGWKLSNAYHPVLKNIPGVWNGMDYQAEVVDGEFEHLAIVDNPRYAESKIFTPEQFKEYNDALTHDLNRVTNSKGDKKMSLKFWEKKAVTKIENAADLEKVVLGLMTTLPKSKKEMSIGDIITNMDASMMPDHYANGEHKVKVGEEEMTVNELVDRHMKMLANKAGDGEAGEEARETEGAEHEGDESALNDAGDTDGEGEDEDGAEEKKKEDKAKKNAADAAKAKAEADKKKAHFESLKNANKVDAEPETFIDTSQDKCARGVSRYGSNA